MVSISWGLKKYIFVIVIENIIIKKYLIYIFNTLVVVLPIQNAWQYANKNVQNKNFPILFFLYRFSF